MRLQNEYFCTCKILQVQIALPLLTPKPWCKRRPASYLLRSKFKNLELSKFTNAIPCRNPDTENQRSRPQISGFRAVATRQLPPSPPCEQQWQVKNQQVGRQDLERKNYILRPAWLWRLSSKTDKDLECLMIWLAIENQPTINSTKIVHFHAPIIFCSY